LYVAEPERALDWHRCAGRRDQRPGVL